MGASKDFEYKIHLSVSADDFTPDIQKIFKNAQQQADKNQVKLTLTGDDTDLVKQLASLKSKLPKIDLQNSINVGLSDALKADTERAQQYTDTFLTNIINKVNETLNTISFLESEIDKTQKALDSKIKIRDKDLGAGDASKALDNLIDKFKKITVDPKNIDKLKDTYQKITDISSSTGKNVEDSIKNTVENIKTSLGDIFKDIKPSKTYEEYMENISSEVFGLENKLVNLNKQLESAKSPDLKVKGKLTDDFLPDLQNQLDSLTGLEVKVKPIVDKDVKLEVEAEIKPTRQSIKETAKNTTLNDVDLTNLESITNKISEYKSKAKSIADSAQKSIDELNKFTGKSYSLDRNMYDIPSTIRGWNKPSLSANDFKKEIKSSLEANDKERAAVLYDNLKTFYPKSTATLKTFKDSDFEKNYNNYLSQGTEKLNDLLLEPNLQNYRGLEDALHELQIKETSLQKEAQKTTAELERQEKVSSELSKIDVSSKDSRDSALQSIDQQISEKEAEIQKLLDAQKEINQLTNQSVNQENTQEYKDLLEKYNIPEGSSFLESLKYLANQGVELTDSVNVLKDMRDTITSINDEAKSTDETLGLSSTNQQIEGLKKEQQQAESTAESLDKIDQELNDDTTSSGLDSIDSDIQDIGNSSEKSSQEVAELKDAIKDLGDVDIGALDIDRITNYGVDKEGNEVSSSIYKVKGENITGVLDEEMNVMKTTTSVARGYTQAQQEMADQAEVTAQLEAEVTKQLDIQANKWKNFDKSAVQNYKEQWGELTDKVKEYVNYREEVAKSGKLDTDQSVSSKIEEMENSIYRMTDALIDNPLYNQSFETKALSGLDSIEQKIQSIRFDKIISNYKQLSSLQLEKYNLTTKGVPENNGYIEYLNSRISKINEETEALRTLEYTEEQLTAIRDAEVSSLKSVEKQQSVNSATAKKYEQTLESTRAALQKQAASLTSNGKLMKVYGDQVNALIEEIKNPNTTLERLNQIRNELNKISAEAVAAGKSGKSLFQILQQRAQSLVAYLSTFASFYRVVSYVRQAFSTITDLDTQLVDLRKTTSMTTSELNEFYNSSSDVAKELGTTTSQIISQAAAWSRLGYSTKEASTEMAKLSSQFAAISPGMTTDESTDYLVSTMQAYGVAVDEVERKIMDNVNRIGNTFATTNAEIGEMLTRSSAAMHAANNSLEETIALESAAVEITRNAETTGTAFRTISMRIRGYDEETEELSDDLQNISGDIADLTKTSKNAPISIFTDATRTEYKSTYQILKEIAGVWENLTDKQQANKSA